MEKKDKRFLISTILLIVVHVAGIIGLHSTYKELFLSLTPFNLLISAFLLALNHRQFNRSFIFFTLIIFFAGFFIEVIGVKSGLLFGNYYYGNTLGWKLMNVPIVIGVNWLMLIYSAGIISDQINRNIYLKSTAGAALLVGLDLLIEQSAGKYGFWQWLNTIIPFQNYIAWFCVSFIFLLLFHSVNFNKSNKLAGVLLAVQFLFFALLFIL
jgi:uncharacterized membrane protein